MSTTKQLLKQLKNRDPEQRILAIKKLAKLRSRDALPQLARMAGDDKDPKVRDIAQKAGAYILDQTGGKPKTQSSRAEIPDDTPPEAEYDKKGKLVKVAVGDDDKAKADALVDEAMSMKDRNQISKAMKSLSKALAINPNLREDPYFLSLAEAVTDLPGEDGIAKLYSKKMRNEITQKEIDDRKQQRLKDHDELVSRTSWTDVGFDLTLFAIIASVMSVVVGVLVVQSAQGYVDRIAQNAEDVTTARTLGNVVTTPDDSTDIRYYLESDDEGEPILFSLATYDAGFLETATELGDTELLVILGLGLAIGVSSAIQLAILNVITHLVSSKMLSGAGNIRYLMHKNTSLLMNRTVLYGIILGLGAVIIFSSGGGVILQIIGGVVGLFSLFVTFKLISIVGNAYDFGFVKGFVATSIASTVVSLLVGVGMIFVM